ncbi:MAG: hypothetical protein KJO21_06990 [Verrucomicrobiae bacterium]|nr:hypothetical protein [Verrucomicrobiae bacterium]NNJ43862.1 hypothetical protein [Akkermansiaceae bacterium]
MNQSVDRLPEPPAAGFADDEEAREYGRQLAMDLLLHRLHRSSAREDKTRSLRRWIAGARPAAAAAALMLFGMTWAWLSLDHSKPKQEQWRVEPVGEAEYKVLAPRRVVLESGELIVPANAEVVVIETAHAVVSAVGARFVIESESSAPSELAPMGAMSVTRVRVLTGEVTLKTAGGSVVGRANEVLEFEDGKAPKNLGVRAESGGD